MTGFTFVGTFVCLSVAVAVGPILVMMAVCVEVARRCVLSVVGVAAGDSAC